MTLHELLDTSYGADGDERLAQLLEAGADLDAREGDSQETPLHVAVRRYRPRAVQLLLDHGADINARTAGGKTAYAHAVRRGFSHVTALLRLRGADTALTAADRLSVALVSGHYDEARSILADQPGAACTGNPEEDRVLADVAGRNAEEPVIILIDAGADLTATGLDQGTPLHQAAWFGQPRNTQLLVEAGAPMEVFDATHGSSPLGWAVHGSRYSGGAGERQDAYVSVVTTLLEAGARLHYPNDASGDAYAKRLLEDASPAVADVLREAMAR